MPGKRFKKNRGGRRDPRGNNGGGYWPEIERTNAQFESYYNDLAVVPEEERSEFWEAMRRDLPTSFRFTGSKGHALAVQKRLVDHYIPKVTEIIFEGKKVPPPTQLDWFPEKLAWHMTTPKTVVRKNPNFTPLQKFLVSETAVGNISRQEVVSMIPPLFMGIEPGMTVLDMCAAPGSKTAQLCEMLHTGEEARVRQLMRKLANEDGREPSPDGEEIAAEADEAESKGDHTDDGRATGLLIANDNNYQRAQMLIHQIKRLNSPNLIVTCHDATMFPSIKVKPERGRKIQYLKFDRILADVPCSGDGTCRKNVNVWKDWNPANGLGLHVTQTRILTRALQMLKVGGRVVYSTCSLNPIENEAVLSAAIDRCGGLSQVNLVYCSQELPKLKRRPGLRSWTVMEKSGRKWSSWDDVEAARSAEGEDTAERLASTMFPPSYSDGEEEIPFERSMRVYPHLQDSGGFFIAILEKKSEIKARPENVPARKPDLVAQTDEVAGATDEDKTIANPGSVVAVVNEIESQTEAGKLPESKEDRPALETFAPTQMDAKDPLNGSAEPVVRQNLPGEPLAVAAKRELEAEDGQSSPSKRLKADDGPVVQTGAAPVTAVKPSQAQGSKRNQTQEESFKFLDPENSVLQEINSFYGISPRFPRDRYMVRNPSGDPVKAIYYTSSLAKEILTENEGRAMKFVHCGVKMFMKQDAQGQDVCRWRIQAEGLPILDPWVSESRVVRLYKRSTLFKLLQEMFPKVGGGAWQDLNEIGERMRDMSMGCCILRVEPSDDEDGFRDRLVLPLWRSLHSLNLMLPKEERKATLLRLYGMEVPLIDNSNFIKNKNKNKNGQAAQNGSVPAAGNDPSAPVDIEDIPTPEPVAEAEPPALSDDEEGGVPIPPDTSSAAKAESYGIETKEIEMEDAVQREETNAQDQRKEAAAGIDDEEQRFNTTV